MRYLLCILIFLAGCINEGVKPVSVSPDVQTISSTMVDMSPKDIEIAYKQFSGLVLYLEYTSAKKIDSTPKLFKVIGDFQSDYEYEKGKYTKYTDAVEQFLLKNEYKVPKKIDSTNLNKVINDMKVLADAAKLAMKDK